MYLSMAGSPFHHAHDLLVCETAKDSLKKQEFFFKFQKPFHLSFAEKNE